MQVKKQSISILSQNSFVASFSITFRKVFLGWPEYAAAQKNDVFVLACRGDACKLYCCITWFIKDGT